MNELLKEDTSLIITLATCAILTTPHLLYFKIWNDPEWWMRTSKQRGQDAVDRFKNWQITIKVLQMSAAALWWYFAAGEQGRKEAIF